MMIHCYIVYTALADSRSLLLRLLPGLAGHRFLNGALELLDLPLDPLFPTNENGALLLQHLHPLRSIVAGLGVRKRKMDVETKIQSDGGRGRPVVSSPGIRSAGRPAFVHNK